jgi:hypothetical protein
MAAIPHPRRSAAPPAWAGALGMALGTALGAALCWVLATVL